MHLYVPIIGIALALAVIAMFIASYFGGNRTRNLTKPVGKLTPKGAAPYRDGPVSSGPK